MELFKVTADTRYISSFLNPFNTYKNDITYHLFMSIHLKTRTSYYWNILIILKLNIMI